MCYAPDRPEGRIAHHRVWQERTWPRPGAMPMATVADSRTGGLGRPAANSLHALRIREVCRTERLPEPDSDRADPARVGPPGSAGLPLRIRMRDSATDRAMF